MTLHIAQGLIGPGWDDMVLRRSGLDQRFSCVGNVKAGMLPISSSICISSHSTFLVRPSRFRVKGK
jgi:hypothetical protein